MEKPFYREELKKHGIETLTPKKNERDYIHQTIWEELSRGVLLPNSRRRYLDIINGLVIKGAQGIVLGCTEIPLLVTQNHTTIKLFDTAVIHAEKALQYALET